MTWTDNGWCTKNSVGTYHRHHLWFLLGTDPGIWSLRRGSLKYSCKALSSYFIFCTCLKLKFYVRCQFITANKNPQPPTLLIWEVPREVDSRTLVKYTSLQVILYTSDECSKGSKLRHPKKVFATAKKWKSMKMKSLILTVVFISLGPCLLWPWLKGTGRIPAVVSPLPSGF